MEISLNNRTLRLIEGDITEQSTDAIVNAANQYLQLGSGVAGAIYRKGGLSIQDECDTIGHCPVGSAVITGSGNLPAGYVIHAVGPLWSKPKAKELLESATLTSLAVAEENNLTSITFPAISTGVFGYPIEKCAAVMLEASANFLINNAQSLNLIQFCLFGQSAFDVFRTELKRQHGEQ